MILDCGKDGEELKISTLPHSANIGNTPNYGTVRVDHKDNIFVSDEANKCVWSWDSSGIFLKKIDLTNEIGFPFVMTLKGVLSACTYKKTSDDTKEYFIEQIQLFFVHHTNLIIR